MGSYTDKCNHQVVPPVLFRTNYYSIEILHGVTAIILTYHPHHAKLQVLRNHHSSTLPSPAVVFAVNVSSPSNLFHLSPSSLFNFNSICS